LAARGGAFALLYQELPYGGGGEHGRNSGAERQRLAVDMCAEEPFPQSLVVTKGAKLKKHVRVCDAHSAHQRTSCSSSASSASSASSSSSTRRCRVTREEDDGRVGRFFNVGTEEVLGVYSTNFLGVLHWAVHPFSPPSTPFSDNGDSEKTRNTTTGSFLA
jgi:hypothetical protein